MTLAQLRHLLAIVDAGMNITAAARRVNATQPGLSRQIQLLEHELGALLFIRQGKTLSSLTELGHRVVESARNIVTEAATIKTLAASSGASPSLLRIATTHTQARLLLPRPLAMLRQRHPDLAVRFLPSGARESVEMIETGVVDLALVSNVRRPSNRDICLPIYRWNLVGLLPREQRIVPIEHGLTIADLASVPLVTYDSMLEPDTAFCEVFRSVGLEPRIAVTARDTDTIKTYVRAGMGMGILAEFAIADHDHDMNVVDLHDLFSARTTWAIIRRQQAIPTILKAIVHSIVPGFDLSFIERGEEHSVVPPHWKEMGFSLQN